MDWPIFIIAGTTLVALVLNLVQLFHYESPRVSRWMLFASDCTVLALCVAILSKGTP